jgi:hypothetical protein
LVGIGLFRGHLLLCVYNSSLWANKDGEVTVADHRNSMLGATLLCMRQRAAQPFLHGGLIII